MGEKLLRVTLHRPSKDNCWEANYALLWWKNNNSSAVELLERIDQRSFPWYRVLAYDKFNKEAKHEQTATRNATQTTHRIA